MALTFENLDTFPLCLDFTGMSFGDRSAPRFIKWIEMRGLGTAIHTPSGDGVWTSLRVTAKDEASMRQINGAANGFDFYGCDWISHYDDLQRRV